VADVRRLRATKAGPAFQATLKHHRIQESSDRAKAISDAIGRLRSAEWLPLDGDQEVQFPGAVCCWAHTFASRLWIYYRTDPTGADEYVELMSVRDHLHEQ
jgi:hypothetical protein